MLNTVALIADPELPVVVLAFYQITADTCQLRLAIHLELRAHGY
jgi:hypothetical protein